MAYLACTTMPYTVRVWDNAHYGDPSDAYDEGTYATYAEALEEAKKVVSRSVYQVWQPGFTLDQLATQYCLYGEDPGIIAEGAPAGPHFSARDYANEVYPKVLLVKLIIGEG